MTNPFFDEQNAAIQAIVPLAQRKFALDQDEAKLNQAKTQFESSLTETKRAHDLTAGTSYLKEFISTGNPQLLTAAQKLLTPHVGADFTGMQASPEVMIKKRGLADIESFRKAAAGITDPAELAKLRATMMPETAGDYLKTMAKIDEDKADVLLKKAHANYYNQMPGLIRDRSRNAANKTPAQIQIHEYYRKLYGDDFAQAIATRTKSPSEAKVWADTYTGSIKNYEAPELALQKADSALNQYRAKFPAAQGGGAPTAQAPTKTSWKKYAY